MLRVLVHDGPHDAAEIYASAEAIPATSTRLRVLASDPSSTVIDGEVPVAGSSHALLLWAIHHDKPHVLKISQSCSASDECRFYASLSADEASRYAFVPVKVLRLPRSRADHGAHEGVLMPHYPMTLAQLPAVAVARVAVLMGQRLLQAVEFIASKGWVHGDVKPSNIFVDHDGAWWLGDYGSAAEMSGDPLLGGTASFQLSGVDAGASFDVVGLLLSLLDALGVLDRRRPLAPVAVDTAQQAVGSLLDAHASLGSDVAHLHAMLSGWLRRVTSPH